MPGSHPGAALSSRRPAKLLSVAAWVALVAAAGIAAGGSRPCSPELFRVVRSTNANVVAYEARTTAAGLDESEPVHPVWLMLAEAGRREELNLLEQEMAYGVDVVPTGGDVGIALRARPGLAIRILLEQGCPVARMRIAGREARLLRIVVEATTGLFPGVRRIDVEGEDVATGAEVQERVVPAG